MFSGNILLSVVRARESSNYHNLKPVSYKLIYWLIFFKVCDRVNDRVSDKAGDKARKAIGTSIVPQSREKLLEILGLKNHPDNYNRYIKPLIEEGWLEMTESDLTSRNQKYRTTKSGKILLQLISKT